MSDLVKRFISFMLIFAVFGTSNLCIAGSVTAPRDNSTVIYSEKKEEVKNVKPSKRLEKSKTIAMILAAFFGLHHFYLKNNITGVVYVGLAVVYGIGWALSLIDLVVMLNMDDAEWNEYLSSEKSIIWL